MASLPGHSKHRCTRLFGPAALEKIPNNHQIFIHSLQIRKRPSQHRLRAQCWGDDLVHDYLKAVTVNGRIGVLYSNKDYGCEWDYDFRNKRFLAGTTRNLG